MSRRSFRKSGLLKFLVGMGCVGVPILGLILAFAFFPSLRFLLYTTSFFDGFFPAGEYHFRITNGSNEPVRGARLMVFKGGTQNPALGYPIDNYRTVEDLTSNESGLIIAIHQPRGFEWGGICEHFLVVFKKCDDIPDFDFVITADGYKAISFSDQIIYGIARADNAVGTVAVTIETGYEVEIPIYELNYILEK